MTNSNSYIGLYGHASLTFIALDYCRNVGYSLYFEKLSCSWPQSPGLVTNSYLCNKTPAADDDEILTQRSVGLWMGVILKLKVTHHIGRMYEAYSWLYELFKSWCWTRKLAIVNRSRQLGGSDSTVLTATGQVNGTVGQGEFWPHTITPEPTTIKCNGIG